MERVVHDVGIGEHVAPDGAVRNAFRGHRYRPSARNVELGTTSLDRETPEHEGGRCVEVTRADVTGYALERDDSSVRLGIDLELLELAADLEGKHVPLPNLRLPPDEPVARAVDRRAHQHRVGIEPSSQAF